MPMSVGIDPGAKGALAVRKRKIAKVIGIDPGATGAFVWNGPDGLQIERMPKSYVEIYDRLKEIKKEFKIKAAAVEKVGSYVSGDSGPSAVKFARHNGNLESALYALGLPAVYVTPLSWQKWLGSFPTAKRVEGESDDAFKARAAKAKAERKTAIYKVVKELYPGVKICKRDADAVGIYLWGMEYWETSDNE